MKARPGLILLLALAFGVAAALVGLLVRNTPSFLAADIEPIPAPPPGAAERAVPRPRSKAVLGRPEPAQRVPEEVVGIGVAIAVYPQDGALHIMQVIPNSPAAQAGLEKGWIVGRIDEQSTTGMPMRECVERLRGVVGSKVRLELTSPDLERTNVVELTRQRLQL
jgi:S1-C subfamily serine protease